MYKLLKRTTSQELNNNKKFVNSLILVQKELLEREIRKLVLKIPFESNFYSEYNLTVLDIIIGNEEWTFHDLEDLKEIPEELIKYKEILFIIFNLYAETNEFGLLIFDTNEEPKYKLIK